ncbi:Sodium/calcium exchanger 1 [Schistosoma japonicum]|uniref:Sodium/calcium exchanger 1 n=1 Tax=Schistosoma japonicum TaxID=6182 RepID=A0A4Z2DTF5_SCHJA|nr:Sodium/calcium exchanger 1 [Schistosoma japonicum]
MKERIIIIVLFLSIIVEPLSAEKLVNGTCPSSLRTFCYDGIIVPMWRPSTGITAGDKAARAIVYFSALMYLFLGVSIIADRFMAAIEVITSQEKEVIVRRKNGETQTISVRIWNETVSNLTLMALGSSAPEILLSVIEIIGKNFEAGDLGPGTIVGSAAFNLFVIIGVCIIVVPDGQIRRIKHLSVFFITSSWSLFAYLWMYLIIAVFTPGVVEVWEALLTFIFFPVIVICAYIADTKIFFKKFLKKKYRATALMKAANGDLELTNHTEEVTYSLTDGELLAEESEFDRHRMDYVDAIKEIRKRNPNIGMKELEELAQMEVLNKGPKSRAYYRMQATRQLTGSGNVIKKAKVERRMSFDDNRLTTETYPPHVQRFFFNPGHYTVMENVGTFPVTVTRVGGDMHAVVSVEYFTLDGTAVAEEDYEPVKGVLLFSAGETHKQIMITIIDDDIFEEDEHFTVHLRNLEVKHSKTKIEPVLVDPMVATIMVLDDDHSGVFQFEVTDLTVSESCEFAEVKVQRVSGCRGVVRLPYQTSEGTAKGGGKDFEDTVGYIEFQNDQTEGIIRIRITDDNNYEKSEYFYVQLGEPVLIDKDAITEWETIPSHLFSRFSQRSDSLISGSGSVKKRNPLTPSAKDGNVNPRKSLGFVETGKPRLGQQTRIKITITESTEFKNTVDRLVKQGTLALVVGTSSWKEQFIEAITVSAGGDVEGEDDEEKLPTCMDYVMHFLTVFWKVLFAFVPPTDYGGGWLCFSVCILVIGVLTAVIGDVASSFGCSIGLTDAVTAITFVALGTSLPDTFASKVAAVGDQYADSSIGNVTGSNAVNVFLGIGLGWSIAAIYHAIKGTQFLVQPGSLGFSVTTYCIFALFAIVLIMYRRKKSIGGELGGPKVAKYVSASILFFLWFVYILLAGLENYCIIEGF